MKFLVVFNQLNGTFTVYSYNRFEENQDNIVFISYHETQEQAEQQANKHNEILKSQCLTN